MKKQQKYVHTDGKICMFVAKLMHRENAMRDVGDICKLDYISTSNQNFHKNAIWLTAVPTTCHFLVNFQQAHQTTPICDGTAQRSRANSSRNWSENSRKRNTSLDLVAAS